MEDETKDKIDKIFSFVKVFENAKISITMGILGFLLGFITYKTFFGACVSLTLMLIMGLVSWLGFIPFAGIFIYNFVGTAVIDIVFNTTGIEPAFLVTTVPYWYYFASAIVLWVVGTILGLIAIGAVALGLYEAIKG